MIEADVIESTLRGTSGEKEEEEEEEEEEEDNYP
jgi:hypothetical protein